MFLQNVGFVQHIQCYKVLFILKAGMELNCHPLDLYNIRKNNYVRMRYRICQPAWENSLTVYAVVRQECPLHAVCGFDATTSLPPDIMHDCLKKGLLLYKLHQYVVMTISTISVACTKCTKRLLFVFVTSLYYWFILEAFLIMRVQRP